MCSILHLCCSQVDVCFRSVCARVCVPKIRNTEGGSEYVCVSDPLLCCTALGVWWLHHVFVMLIPSLQTSKHCHLPVRRGVLGEEIDYRLHSQDL